MHREMNLELPRFPEIVGIQERDVVASDLVQPAVAGDRCARVLRRDVTYGRSELSAQPAALVGSRTVASFSVTTTSLQEPMPFALTSWACTWRYPPSSGRCAGSHATTTWSSSQSSSTVPHAVNRYAGWRP